MTAEGVAVTCRRGGQVPWAQQPAPCLKAPVLRALPKAWLILPPLLVHGCRSQRFTFKHNLYKLREERDIKPSSFAQLVSATLYERRFGPYFCQPVIAGLEPDGTPFLCGMDSIGAIEFAKDFMVAGTGNDSLLGICESLWRPDMVRRPQGLPWGWLDFLFEGPPWAVRCCCCGGGDGCA